jgi:hypothetical protein
MKPEKVEFERKPEKLSLRKELKRKCQGGDLISGPDDLSSPLGVGPVERAFEAKISDVFHFGFTLEATIDGKPLRGLVFSYKPGFAHAAHNYVNRLIFSSQKPHSFIMCLRIDSNPLYHCS